MDMEYRRLGRSGLKVSALSFGSWVTFGTQMGVGEARKCMEAAYAAGVNFFDNAEVYAQGESERIMGEILQQTGWSRDSWVVSSKAYWGGELPTQKGLHRKHLREACDAALQRLRVEYLDLFFCHRPDLETPIEETVYSMDDLVRQGKVLYWGTSEWSAQQIQEAYGVARRYGLHPPTMEQPEYSMLHRDRVEVEYAPLYEEIGLGTTIWSPLASGILTGKYKDGVPKGSRMDLEDYRWLRRTLESDRGQERVRRAAELEPVARDLDCSLAQLAIAWCLKNPNVSTVLLGASRVSQLEENLKAMDVARRIDDEVIERIEAILDNKPEPPRQW